jgi:hypothetical protein
MLGRKKRLCVLIYKEKLARPERFELPTNWFEASYSIQLSYGRKNCSYYLIYYRLLVPVTFTADIALLLRPTLRAQ